MSTTTEIGAADVAEALGMNVDQSLEFKALEQFEIETKCAGYIKRQDGEIEKIRRHEGLRIPAQLDFLQIDGLSNELRQKLDHHKPDSLARAAMNTRHDASGSIDFWCTQRQTVGGCV